MCLCIDWTCLLNSLWNAISAILAALMCVFKSLWSLNFLRSDSCCFALSVPKAWIKHALHSLDSFSPLSVWPASDGMLLHVLQPSLLSLKMSQLFGEQNYIIWSLDQQSGHPCVSLLTLLLTSVSLTKVTFNSLTLAVPLTSTLTHEAHESYLMFLVGLGPVLTCLALAHTFF